MIRILINTAGHLLVWGSILSAPVIFTLKKKNDDVTQLKQVFKNCSLSVKTKRGDMHLPELLQRKELQYGVLYTFSIPPGLELSSFKNKQQAIEHQLEGECNIWSEGNRLKIESMTNNIPENIKFDKEYIVEQLADDTLGFSVGYSHAGFLTNDLTSAWCHILIGGRTGAGKSILVNQAILSIILTYTPQFVEIHMLDLKGGLESVHFEDSPHIKTMLSDIDEIRSFLPTIVHELEMREKLLRNAKCRDLTSYKNKTKSDIPYIVVAIDEFAILSPFKDIVEMIQVLLSKGRALGIHLFISTQRPEAKVIPGLLKANLPASIAMQVKTEIDSRILLDNSKAAMLEPIPGRGVYQVGRDMKIQVPYIDEDTIEKLIEQRNKELGIVCTDQVVSELNKGNSNEVKETKKKGKVFA